MSMKHLPILELAPPSLILKNSKVFTHIPALPHSSAAPRASLDPGRWAPRSLTPPTAAFTSIPGKLGRENKQMGQGGAGTRHQAAVPQSTIQHGPLVRSDREPSKGQRHTPSQSFLLQLQPDTISLRAEGFHKSSAKSSTSTNNSWDTFLPQQKTAPWCKGQRAEAGMQHLPRTSAHSS